ncbi:adenylosuccinate synthetase [Leeuwenhoekiella sp. NPDC079379]|uniref:adenylosuccinate synthetase n=1 Tax=Leeuwenhoekiella sp. NPDC079379 TaxID=3364122 RepID=UPI0037CB0245
MLNLLFIQLPHGTQNPDDNNPIDFSSPFDLIVFIILPIVVILFYVWWRRKRNRRS